MKVLDWLKAKGETLDACVVGEPSNPVQLGDEIKIGRRGSLTGELVVHGKQGHAAYPAKADNPIPKLARILDRLSSQPIDKGTAKLRAVELPGDGDLGAEHGLERHPARGARDIQHPLQRHLEPADESRIGCAYSATLPPAASARAMMSASRERATCS